MDWTKEKDHNMAGFYSRLEHDGAPMRQPLFCHQSRDIEHSVPDKNKVNIDSSQFANLDYTPDSAILQTTRLFTSTTCTPCIPAAFARQHNIPGHHKNYDSGFSSDTSSTNSINGFGSSFAETKNLEDQIQQLNLSLEKPKDPFGNMNNMQETVIGILTMTQQLNQQNDDGDTNLHLAILHGDLTVLADILQNMFFQDSLDIQNNHGQTPLHVAIILDHYEVARTLLACGARLTIQDTEGRTPLHIACEKGDLEGVKTLTKPLEHWECKSAENMMYTVKPQSIPQPGNVTNFEGETCIHIAAKQGRFDIIEYLADQCAHDINAQEVKSGKTILHKANDAEDEDMLKFLLHHKNINPYIEDYNGHSALLLAHFHPKSLAVLHTVFPHLREILEEKFEEMEADDEAANKMMNGN